MSNTQRPQDGTGIVAEIPGYGILIAAGTTVPSDGASGYAIGCVFHHLDGGNATALYVNEGTNSSCNFNAITVEA